MSQQPQSSKGVIQPGGDQGAGGESSKVQPKYTQVLKLLEYAAGKTGEAARVIATVEMEKLPPKATLLEVRNRLGTMLDRRQGFCYDDGSKASEYTLLDKYNEYLHEKNLINTADTNNHSIVRPRQLYAYPIPPSPDPKIWEMMANGAAFVITVSQWEMTDGTGSLISRGTVHSKAFQPTKDPSALTLAELRPIVNRLTPMSSKPSLHKYCTRKGVTVADESMSFAEYLKLEEAEEPTKAELPSVSLVYKLSSATNQPTFTPDKLAEMPGGSAKVDYIDVANLTTQKSAKSISLGTDRAFSSSAGFDNLSAENVKSMKSAAWLTEAEWAGVLDSCGVMYGWFVDRKSNQIVRAKKKAFQLRAKEPEDLNPIHLVQEEAKAQQEQGTGDEKKPAQSEPNEAQTRGSPPVSVIPTIRVNDDSKIEVTMTSHEFETSLAKNNFSSLSVEASMSGGYAGFSAKVSGGYATQSESASVQTSSTYKKTLIANYLPEDLEPTPGLKKAIQKIEKHKDIRDLRQLYQDYGHLFCQHVTIGGRLQSTKILTETKETHEQSEKEQFKRSVGVQVSTPFGGGGTEISQQGGSGQQKNQGQMDVKETLVFEAVGGNTILAAMPAEWALSVGQFENWRVISRDSLSPIADVISAMPDFSRVKDYFVQATPILSTYIEVPPDREVMLRFRMTAPTNDLSRSYIQKQLGQQHVNPMYYLGHFPGETVEPCVQTVKEDVINDVKVYVMGNPPLIHEPLFVPSKYRAPVIIGYNPTTELETMNKYEQEFMNSIWSVTAPFDNQLVHGGKVYIKTVPLNTPQFAPQDGEPAAAVQQNNFPYSSTLSVFRNQQGVFLPCMSSMEEVQYWRILKAGTAIPGDPIKEGDTVRLSWRIQDQKVGFRDYENDIFGRRRNHIPSELESAVLYLKMPWPRFESTISFDPQKQPLANTLIMGSHDGTDDFPTIIPNMPAIKTYGVESGQNLYFLQNVEFRIDTVANRGHGDTHDYLLNNVQQSQLKDDYATIVKNRNEQQRLKASYDIFFLGT